MELWWKENRRAYLAGVASLMGSQGAWSCESLGTQFALVSFRGSHGRLFNLCTEACHEVCSRHGWFAWLFVGIDRGSACDRMSGWWHGELHRMMIDIGRAVRLVSRVSRVIRPTELIWFVMLLWCSVLGRHSVHVIRHFIWCIASRTPSRTICRHRNFKKGGWVFAYESIMRLVGRWKIQFIKHRGGKGAINTATTAAGSSTIWRRSNIMTAWQMVQSTCIRLLHYPSISLSCVSHIHFQNV